MIFHIRPYLVNQLQVIRHIHVSRSVLQSNNRPFVLTRKNRKDKIDVGAWALLVCFTKYFHTFG